MRITLPEDFTKQYSIVKSLTNNTMDLSTVTSIEFKFSEFSSHVNPQKQNLETPIQLKYSSVTGCLCKIKQQSEYHFSQKYNVKKAEELYFNTLSLYTTLDNIVSSQTECLIDHVFTGQKNQLILHLSIGKDNLHVPFAIEIPSIDTVNSAKETEFIDRISSGSITNIEGKYIPIEKKSNIDSSEVISTDLRFDTFVIYTFWKQNSKSNGIFSSLF